MLINRRQLLVGGAGLAALAGLGKFWWPTAPEVTGSIVGAASHIGHKLREGNFVAPTSTIQKDTVIIGGGIAGLSAAWKLHKSGYSDFMLLELEKEVGGNASYSENTISPYPWGAHYVPLLTEESTSARELFSDLGIITGYENGLPVYNEYYLSYDPDERLYMHGRWQEGLVPQIGINESDKAQYDSFFARMEYFRHAKGKDCKKAFAIPLDKSSADAAFRTLDAISMTEYMTQQGWDSPYLRWYIDYCCRDDYGAPAAETSAWAGIHYFASRSGTAANAEHSDVVTWPEGNGWIVKQLKSQLADYLRTQALAYKVEPYPGGVRVEYWNAAKNETIAIEAKSVIIAAPRFVAQRLTQSSQNLSEFSYSPWMVANITVSAMPQGKGAALAWDNMIYDSKLLGYVVATHQNLNRVQRQTVLTYYWPLSHLPPKQAREEAYKRSYKEWRDIVLNELYKIHPELKDNVKSLDIWLWGHGMIRPTPGFVWGKDRQQTLKQTPPIFYAHSDMSGISIFEEANHHGVAAAELLMKHHRHTFRSSL